MLSMVQFTAQWDSIATSSLDAMARTQQAARIEEMNLSRRWNFRGVKLAELAWRNEGGVVSVEFALVSTFLMLAFLCAADVGLALYARTRAANAARAGIEYAAINGWNSTAISTAAQNATSLSINTTPTTYCGCATATGITTATCGTTCSAGNAAATYVKVSVTASYSPLMRGLWGTLLNNKLLNMTTSFVTRTN
jgi:Flp pilus assembly protein TadG